MGCASRTRNYSVSHRARPFRSRRQSSIFHISQHREEQLHRALSISRLLRIRAFLHSLPWFIIIFFLFFPIFSSPQDYQSSNFCAYIEANLMDYLPRRDSLSACISDAHKFNGFFFPHSRPGQRLHGKFVPRTRGNDLFYSRGSKGARIIARPTVFLGVILLLPCATRYLLPITLPPPPMNKNINGSLILCKDALSLE